MNINANTFNATTFAVLTSLAAGPQHGYGILSDVAELLDDRPPPVGSLYRVLDRLVADGHVEAAGEEVVDGRFRRYYRLTDTGAAALDAAAAERQRTARIARQRLRHRLGQRPSGAADGALLGPEPAGAQA